MPDVFQKVKEVNAIDNGAAIVRYNELTPPTGIPPKVNQTHVIAQSGTLDSRFDDNQYYTC